MLLAIDIGNTTLQVGIYSDRELGPTWRLATDHGRLADEYGILVVSLLRAEGIDPSAIDGAIVSSVVPGAVRRLPRCRAAASSRSIRSSSPATCASRSGLASTTRRSWAPTAVADAVGAMTRPRPAAADRS